jgi:hypothetical protein
MMWDWRECVAFLLQTTYGVAVVVIVTGIAMLLSGDLLVSR